MTFGSGFWASCVCDYCVCPVIFLRALNGCGLYCKLRLIKEYETEGWDNFSMATEPILRRTLRKRPKTFEAGVECVRDEVQPLIPSRPSSIDTGNVIEMEQSPYMPVMQSTTSRAEHAGSVFHDDMENSLDTSDPRSTPGMSQQEVYFEQTSKKSLEVYHQQKNEERQWQETDHLMAEDIVDDQDPSIGDSTKERIPEITNPFEKGDKVLFKVDLSDCEVKKGDCGEVIEIMEMGSVVVRTNNLAIEVKVDHIYLEQATVYRVKFITGICGFGVVPGSRNQNAYVGPTLQSEHARRTVLSGSHIIKVNGRDCEDGYSCREIKKMIKASKRPIWITFRWDQERADAMVESQRAPY